MWTPRFQVGESVAKVSVCHFFVECLQPALFSSGMGSVKTGLSNDHSDSGVKDAGRLELAREQEEVGRGWEEAEPGQLQAANRDWT